MGPSEGQGGSEPGLEKVLGAAEGHREPRGAMMTSPGQPFVSICHHRCIVMLESSGRHCAMVD